MFLPTSLWAVCWTRFYVEAGSTRLLTGNYVTPRGEGSDSSREGSDSWAGGQVALPVITRRSSGRRRVKPSRSRWASRGSATRREVPSSTLAWLVVNG